MANDYKNFTTQIAKTVLENVESLRTLSKNVNVQKLQGVFNPDSGEEYNFKRPIRVKAIRTSDGDLTSSSPSNIITGRAKGLAQDYITTYVEITDVEQALKAGNLNDTLLPMAEELVMELENSQAEFMMANSGLLAGTPGTPITNWKQVATGSTMLKSVGVPASSPWFATVNEFEQIELAEANRSIGAGGEAGKLVTQAVRDATIANRYANMRVMTSSALDSYTTHSGTTRDGTVVSVDVTYNTAKNTMTQAISVTGFHANLEVRVGERLRVTGRTLINLSTRKPIFDGSGAGIDFSGTVTTAVTLNASGAGIIIITGPAIFEASAGDGAYNTTSTAVAASDVVTLLGSASTLIQPSLFWQRDAFAIGSVPMSKLDATDTMATTKDGLQLRVTRFSDGIKNKNIIRMDMRVAFAALNPYFAGHLFG